MNKANVFQQAKSENFFPSGNRLIQRKCACGNQSIAGGKCTGCTRNQLSGRSSLLLPGAKDMEAKAINPKTSKASLSSISSNDNSTGLSLESDFHRDLSKVRAHREVQAAKTKGAPVNEFEDCPENWKKDANAALVVARKWTMNAVTGLANLPYPYPPKAARLLSRHFHIKDRGYLFEVIRHFKTINSALNSPINFECEKKCDKNVAAYVYSIWSDIHLCPVWFNRLSLDGQANTIIHELAHDAANRDDEAYIWQTAYSKLSVEDAIDNADSYSNFAKEAY